MSERAPLPEPLIKVVEALRVLCERWPHCIELQKLKILLSRQVAEIAAEIGYLEAENSVHRRRQFRDW